MVAKFDVNGKIIYFFSTVMTLFFLSLYSLPISRGCFNALHSIKTAPYSYTCNFLNIEIEE